MVKRIIAIVFLCLFYLYLYKLLIPRITAFGCMDDCFNFLGGYFLLHGKKLFLEIFFNHAPFMAHLSAFVQNVTKPQNLFEYVLRHRQFVMLIGIIAEIILTLRFGLVAIPFAIVYELTKFYLGGDRFLAEAIIVYPLAYMIGSVFYKFQNYALKRIDYLVSAISLWFVLFMREPYSILALLLFVFLFWGRREGKMKILSFTIFIGLSLVTLFSYNISELVYNVFTVNKTLITSVSSGTSIFGPSISKAFLYPFVIFFQGEWSFFRYIEIILSVVFLFANGIFLWKKQWKWIVVVWLLLGTANLRIVSPGHEYYEAFHLLPWYALTVFSTCLMLGHIFSWNKRLGIVGFFTLMVLGGFVILSKNSYTHDIIDEHTEFITNFGNELQVGNVVASLSKPSDSLFLDGSDDTIYLVAHRYSDYKYSWYTSRMPLYKKYADERIRMLASDPPDFYYKACSPKTTLNEIPLIVQNNYTRLHNLQNPSCLWVKSTKLAGISLQQWKKAGESLYYLAPTTLH